jgi:RNA polymerase sigma-70 factor (ECF subfamily)
MVIKAGAHAETDAHGALETLCQQYWFPLYTFVRRQGRSHQEAEDCTQEFFARLLASDGITRAQPERGRFRTFLLTALRNFLTNEWHRAHAAKRGGGAAPLSLDFGEAENTFHREPADAALTPEQAFDRTWALSMIECSRARLRDDYEKSGRGALFGALAPLIWGDAPGEAQTALSAQLGMTPHAFSVALHRLRQRLGQRLRADVAETVADDTEVDAELRHLIAAVSAPSSPR